MKILILNGPNLNLLGTREVNLYGKQNFESYFNVLSKHFADIKLEYKQSNIEGELINYLHEADGAYDGVVLNAGGYTHTSVAIGDAIKSISVPVVEVHITNILGREDYRKESMIAAGCIGSISGFGMDSYRLGIESLRIVE